MYYLCELDSKTVGETEKVLSRHHSEILPTGETALVGSLPSTRSMDFV